MVVVVANLLPATLRGVESQGMILCVDENKTGPKVIFLDDETKPGTVIR